MKQRKVYLDMLNIFACICVIYMHCNGIVHTYSNTIEWKQSMVVETIAYWAVPVFFMISGATLLNYRERYDTKTYLKKRFIRIGVPFIVWSMIQLIWKVKLGKLTIECSISAFISALVNSKIENVYWFFIPLFAVYLSIPILSTLVKESRAFQYMIGLGFLTYSVLPTACAVFGITYNNGLNFPLTGGYILYVLLGYYFSTQDFSKRQRYIMYILAILGAGLRYFSTVFLTVGDQMYQTFWGYLNFPTVFLAVGVFVFFRYWGLKPFFHNPKVEKCISKISSTSFGIYLIHMIIMNIFWMYGVNVRGIKWRILGAPLIYIICFVCVKIMQKLPILNKMIP